MTSSLPFIASRSWFVPSADEEMSSRIFSFMSCHSVFVANGQLGFGFFRTFQPRELLDIFPLTFGFLLVAYLAHCWGNTAKCVLQSTPNQCMRWEKRSARFGGFNQQWRYLLFMLFLSNIKLKSDIILDTFQQHPNKPTLTNLPAVTIRVQIKRFAPAHILPAKTYSKGGPKTNMSTTFHSHCVIISL